MRAAASGPASTPSRFLRVRACSCRSFDCISFDVIMDVSVVWLCQTAFMSSPVCLSGIGFPFVKPFRQDVLDSVNPNCHVSWRQPGNLANGCRFHVFEVADDDLSIERFEPLNQSG